MDCVKSSVGLFLLTSLLLGACTAVPRSAPTGTTANADATPSTPARTLNILVRVEPPEVNAAAIDRSSIGRPLFAALLGSWGLDTAPFPVLAQSLPQLNTDTWQVFPDGRMDTTYGLRPGLTWHDGEPLTADDFVFTYRATQARVDWGFQQPNVELRTIESIDAPDPLTVVIHWRQPYALAAATTDLVVLPQHILDPVL